MNRLPYLDYLRGIAAFLIMVYHYILFAIGNPPVETFIKKAGLYGVSVFYVLSGLTLFHVYSQDLSPERKDMIKFFAKRFFRIFPLLWLATFATIYLRGFTGFKILLLNLTGLFSIVDPSAYIATGVWSIGNELTFYLLFPISLFLLNRNKAAFWILTSVTFGLYLYYAFVALPPYSTLVSGIKTYINPLNQVFLFQAGILIGWLFRDVRMNQALLLGLLILSLLAFTFYPVHGDVINLATGFTRLVYTLLSAVIVLCAFKFSFALPSFIGKPLHKLGEISYGLYLLHPLVLIVVQVVFRKFIGPVSVYYILALSMVASLITSYFVYSYFEKPSIRIGNRILAKVS